MDQAPDRGLPAAHYVARPSHCSLLVWKTVPAELLGCWMQSARHIRLQERNLQCMSSFELLAPVFSHLPPQTQSSVCFFCPTDLPRRMYTIFRDKGPQISHECMPQKQASALVHIVFAGQHAVPSNCRRQGWVTMTLLISMGRREERTSWVLLSLLLFI